MSKILIALYMASLPGLRRRSQGPNLGSGDQRLMNQCSGSYDADPDPGTPQLGNSGVAQEYRCPEDISILSRTGYEGFGSTAKCKPPIEQFIESRDD